MRLVAGLLQPRHERVRPLLLRNRRPRATIGRCLSRRASIRCDRVPMFRRRAHNRPPRSASAHSTSTVFVSSSRRLSPVEMTTQPFPGFPTDLQAQLIRAVGQKRR